MNKKTFKSICLVWLTCLLFGSAQVHAQALFRLERNEVVAFLGGANMVYLQKAGYLESVLSGHFVQSSPQFRDLAWEADTVFRQGTVIERWRERGTGGFEQSVEPNRGQHDFLPIWPIGIIRGP